MADEPSSFATGLLTTYRADRDGNLAGFFANNMAIADEAAWERWLAATEPDYREPVIFAAQSLAISYRDRDRDIEAAVLWAQTHLRLTRTLPTWFGPQHSRVDYGRDHHIGIALEGLAKLEIMRGSLSRAYDLLQEAERFFNAEDEVRRQQQLTTRPKISQLMGISDDRGPFYQELARTAWQLGDTAEAQRYASLAFDRRHDDRSAYSEISELINKGEYSLDINQTDTALRYFQRAVALAEGEQIYLQEGKIVSNAYRCLADAYRRSGTPRTALSLLDKARTLAEGTGKRSGLDQIEVSTARVMRDNPTLGDAMVHLLRALEHCSLPASQDDQHQWRAADDRRLRIAAFDDAWPILLEAAEILEERQRLIEAGELLQLATGIAEQVRGGAIDEASRIAVQEQRSHALVDLARIQLSLAHQSESKDFADAAWRTVETLRARTFLDMVGDTDLTPPVEVPAELVEREVALLDNRRRMRASTGRDSVFWAQQETNERELTLTWQTIAAVSPGAAEYVALRQAHPTPPADVAAFLRRQPANTGGQVVIVNLLFTNNEELAYLAVSGTDQHVRVATSRVDRARLTKFTTANFGSATRVRELAIDLEDLFHHELSGVVAPIADLCDPTDTVVVCPAGPVHNIPLGAVRLGQDVLLARNPLVISPSASLLHRRHPVGHRGLDYAVFGDPNGDLTEARREANELALSWGVPAHIGAQATADSLLDALTTAETVHAAAHATFSAEDPLASGIQMADRTLTAREILDVRAQNLDLVTLSACQSGVYSAGPSEDPLGLLRGLLFAGANSVLASLWKVSDSVAYRLMAGFYAALRSGASKPEALRSAALAVREDDNRLDRWAAFILAGSWI